jgi:hypothetical protein
MENSMGNSSNEHVSGLYRTGGVSALALGISYIIITVLYILGGALPGEAEEWLRHLAGHTNEWYAILGLSVLTDFLFLPVAWSLYFALKELHKNAILAGAGFLVLFVVLDLAVTWPNYASLIQLSGKYAAAGAQQTVVIGAANYAFEVLSGTLFGVYTILVPSLGILIIGIIQKEVFGIVTAYLGIITGIMGIISVVGPFFIPSLGMAAVITSVLTLVWLLFVGFKLLKLSRLKSA